jgi:hypothetical protein
MKIAITAFLLTIGDVDIYSCQNNYLFNKINLNIDGKKIDLIKNYNINLKLYWKCK